MPPASSTLPSWWSKEQAARSKNDMPAQGARNWAAVGSAYLSPALGGPHPATSGRVGVPTEQPSQGAYNGDAFSAFDPHPPTPAKPKATHNSGGRLNTTTTTSGANGISNSAFILQAQRHPAAEFASSYLQAGGVGIGRPDHSGAATLLLDNHRATSSRNSKNPVHAVYGVQRASSASRATAHHATGSPARQARPGSSQQNGPVGLNFGPAAKSVVGQAFTSSTSGRISSNGTIHTGSPASNMALNHYRFPAARPLSSGTLPASRSTTRPVISGNAVHGRPLSGTSPSSGSISNRAGRTGLQAGTAQAPQRRAGEAWGVGGSTTPSPYPPEGQSSKIGYQTSYNLSGATASSSSPPQNSQHYMQQQSWLHDINGSDSGMFPSSGVLSASPSTALSVSALDTQSQSPPVHEPKTSSLLNSSINNGNNGRGGASPHPPSSSLPHVRGGGGPTGAPDLANMYHSPASAAASSSAAAPSTSPAALWSESMSPNNVVANSRVGSSSSLPFSSLLPDANTNSGNNNNVSSRIYPSAAGSLGLGSMRPTTPSARRQPMEAVAAAAAVAAAEGRTSVYSGSSGRAGMEGAVAKKEADRVERESTIRLAAQQEALTIDPAASTSAVTLQGSGSGVAAGYPSGLPPPSPLKALRGHYSRSSSNNSQSSVNAATAATAAALLNSSLTSTSATLPSKAGEQGTLTAAVLQIMNDSLTASQRFSTCLPGQDTTPPQHTTQPPLQQQQRPASAMYGTAAAPPPHEPKVTDTAVANSSASRPSNVGYTLRRASTGSESSIISSLPPAGGETPSVAPHTTPLSDGQSPVSHSIPYSLPLPGSPASSNTSHHHSHTDPDTSPLPPSHHTYPTHSPTSHPPSSASTAQPSPAQPPATSGQHNMKCPPPSRLTSVGTLTSLRPSASPSDFGADSIPDVSAGTSGAHPPSFNSRVATFDHYLEPASPVQGRARTQEGGSYAAPSSSDAFHPLQPRSTSLDATSPGAEHVRTTFLQGGGNTGEPGIWDRDNDAVLQQQLLLSRTSRHAQHLLQTEKLAATENEAAARYASSGLRGAFTAHASPNSTPPPEATQPLSITDLDPNSSGHNAKSRSHHTVPSASSEPVSVPEIGSSSNAIRSYLQQASRAPTIAAAAASGPRDSNAVPTATAIPTTSSPAHHLHQQQQHQQYDSASNPSLNRIDAGASTASCASTGTSSTYDNYSSMAGNSSSAPHQHSSSASMTSSSVQHSSSVLHPPHHHHPQESTPPSTTTTTSITRPQPLPVTTIPFTPPSSVGSHAQSQATAAAHPPPSSHPPSAPPSHHVGGSTHITTPPQTALRVSSASGPPTRHPSPPVQQQQHGTRTMAAADAAAVMGSEVWSSAVLPGYSVGKVIGEGGFCQVRVAVHHVAKARVAVKLIDKSKLTDANEAKRIQREIRVMKHLTHATLIQLYEVVDSPEHLYLVMEHAPGGSLLDHVRARKRLGEAEALPLFRQIVSGLEACHQGEVVHRDVKLENILLDEHGHMKIIDFGLSAFFVPGKRLRVHCGSPSYAAPEIVGRQQYEGPPVDVWSLGVVLFAMVCGYLPFHAPGGNKADLCAKITSGTYTSPDWLSAPLKDLLSRMLTLNPSARITFPAVWHHPWVAFPHTPSHSMIQYPLQRTPTTSLIIDVQTLSLLEASGYSRPALLTQLSTGECSYATAAYHLLAQAAARQQQALQALAGSNSGGSNGIGGGSNGNGGSSHQARTSSSGGAAGMAVVGSPPSGRAAAYDRSGSNGDNGSGGGYRRSTSVARSTSGSSHSGAPTGSHTPDSGGGLMVRATTAPSAAAGSVMDSGSGRGHGSGSSGGRQDSASGSSSHQPYFHGRGGAPGEGVMNGGVVGTGVGTAWGGLLLGPPGSPLIGGSGRSAESRHSNSGAGGGGSRNYREMGGSSRGTDATQTIVVT